MIHPTSKRKAKQGFVLLEALVLVTLMTILGASMLASAYNDRQRSRAYAVNNEAQSLAINALYMLLDAENQRLARGGSPLYFTRTLFSSQATLEVTDQSGGRLLQGTVQLKIQPDGVTPSLYTISATATMGNGYASESLEMMVNLVQKDQVPPVLFGAGLCGVLTTSSDNQNPVTLHLGSGTDLFLTGTSPDAALTITDSNLQGNVIFRNLDVTLHRTTVSGMVVTNSNLTLGNSRLDGTRQGENGQNRLSGIYMSTSGSNLLTLLPGNKIVGSVYADQFQRIGISEISESVQASGIRSSGSVVLNQSGTPRSYSIQSRSGGNLPSQLSQPLQDLTTNVSIFTPNSQWDGANIVDRDTTLEQSHVLPDASGRIQSVYYLKAGCTLDLTGVTNPYLLVFGEDTTAKVKVAQGSTITGTLQNVTVEIQVDAAQSPRLNLQYAQPTAVLGDDSYLLAPSSIGRPYSYLSVLSIHRMQDDLSTSTSP